MAQPHLLVDEGDLADVALVPGDPDRVDRIADYCENAETVARNREYKLSTQSTAADNSQSVRRVSAHRLPQSPPRNSTPWASRR
jgi:uridine phosphorylase